MLLIYVVSTGFAGNMTACGSLLCQWDVEAAWHLVECLCAEAIAADLSGRRQEGLTKPSNIVI